MRGALWRAVAGGSTIPLGSEVRVVGRKGLQLQVVASDGGPKDAGPKKEDG